MTVHRKSPPTDTRQDLLEDPTLWIGQVDDGHVTSTLEENRQPRAADYSLVQLTFEFQS